VSAQHLIKEHHMPLFMDVHHLDGGVALGDVANAHMADLKEQANHDVSYLRYWVDEGSGKVFCLSTGPSKESFHACRSFASSGLEPDDRVVMAPFTRIRAGPAPCWSNAIVVPSFDLSVFISSPCSQSCCLAYQ